ncbi:MAG: tetratricopeptide repeat protein [Polyangiaceae bacterium]
MAVFGVCVVTSARAEAAPKRHPIDMSDIGRLATANPHARQLLEEGEAAIEQGDANRAASLFEQAAQEAPTSALCARRHCQALLEMGARDEAILACRRALAREGSPLDLRALVRALTAGKERPTFDELHEITLYVNRAERAMPRQPWGYAAACDVARQLGDAALLDACRKDLERVAPGHAETRRALAAFGGGGSSVGVAIGWGVILLTTMLTAIDAVRRSWLRRSQVARATANPEGNAT